MFRVHYHRYDERYDGVELWVWLTSGPKAGQGRALAPVGSSDFGPCFEVQLGEPGETEVAREIGFLPRRGKHWEEKDGPDRFWTPELGEEIWLVQGDPEIHTERPDIAPQVQAAWIEGERHLRVLLSHGMELGRLIPGTFGVRCVDGRVSEVEAVSALDAHQGKARLVELVLDSPLPLRCETMVLVDGYRPGRAFPRGILFGSERFHSDVELGALCSPGQTTFRVFAPTAWGVDVVLYDGPTGDAGREEYPMENKGRGIWETTVTGDLIGQHYMLKVDAEGESTGREVVDIHSRCNTGHDGRGRIVDLRRLDPPGFRPVRRPENIAAPTDAIIYEIHVRDFTIDASSGVEAELRGKYTGAARRGTRIPGTELSTCLDHLVELGVTHVQLLPVQDFDNDEGRDQYDWGYMTTCFNSPEGWYATNHRDESRVRELKELIAAIHDAGLRVVLDVVYNHTAPSASFEAIVPGYYHRRHEDGTFWNGSGTGNEFRSEAPMARKFIVDSCRFWVEEYGVDGFRFDLMGLIDLETLEAVRDALREVDPTLLVYGEPWAATGPDGTGIERVTYKDVVAGTGIGSFNDAFRNALKGPPDGEEPGYAQDGSHRGAVMAGMMGSVHDWAEAPGEAIQYATCHDNLTLWDKLEASAPEAAEEERLRMQMLVAGILAVSQGVMFLHGGHEMARSKGGDHNSYSAPDRVNRMDWEGKRRHPELFDFVRGMIAIRREHPVFRLRTREEIEARLHFEEEALPAPECIVMQLDGTGLEGEKWAEVLVFVNPTSGELEFGVPEEGDWVVHVQGGQVVPEGLGRAQRTVLVPGSGMALIARHG